jgi:hypothetical protein
MEQQRDDASAGILLSLSSLSPSGCVVVDFLLVLSLVIRRRCFQQFWTVLFEKVTVVIISNPELLSSERDNPELLKLGICV